MKQNIVRTMSYIVTAFSLLWLPSCNHNDEPFSCTPEVDCWVKENLSEVQTMTRSEWLNINDPETERACFRAFTPEQRLLFWIDKLNETLTLDWSNPEKDHIHTLISFIENNPGIFEEYATNIDLQEMTDKFLYLWTETATTIYHWDSNVIYSMIANGNKMLTKHGELAQRMDNYVMSTRANADCDCSSKADYCVNRVTVELPIEPIYPSIPLKKAKCVRGNCNNSGIGCGVLFLQGCDGVCEFYPL